MTDLTRERLAEGPGVSGDPNTVVERIAFAIGRFTLKLGDKNWHPARAHVETARNYLREIRDAFVALLAERDGLRDKLVGFDKVGGRLRDASVKFADLSIALSASNAALADALGLLRYMTALVEASWDRRDLAPDSELVATATARALLAKHGKTANV